MGACYSVLLRVINRISENRTADKQYEYFEMEVINTDNVYVPSNINYSVHDTYKPPTYIRTNPSDT